MCHIVPQAWAKSCKLLGSTLHGRDLEMFWVQVNAAEESTKDLDRHSKPRAFSRHKFIQVLVRIAIKKFCGGGGGGGMTAHEAVEALFEEHLVPLLPP